MRGVKAVNVASLVGDFDRTDIDRSMIAAIGRGVAAGQDAKVIDGADLPVIPGIHHL